LPLALKSVGTYTEGTLAWPWRFGGGEAALKDTGEQSQDDVIDAGSPAADASLRFFLDRAPLMMGTVALLPDGDLRHLYDNPATTRFFGLEPGQSEGRTARSLGVPEGLIALWRRHYEQAEKDDQPVGFEYEHEMPSGTRTVSVTVSALGARTEAGHPLFSYMAQDVTDKRRAQAALAESETTLRAVFEEAAIGLAEVGLDGRWLRVNPRLCQMLGYTEVEFADLTFQDISHPDDLAADLAEVERLLAGEASSYVLDKRYFRRDGSVMWAQLTVSLLRGPDGTPDRFVSVVEDISARKAAEEALRLTERRLAMATRAAGLGVWEWVFGSETVHYSARAREICGFGPDEALTIAAVVERVHPDDYDMVRERASRSRGGEREPAKVEYRVMHPELGVRWVRSLSTVVGEDDESGEGRWRAFGTLEDITEPRENEERLRLLMREVDHRANNLLTVVQSVVALSRAGDVESFRAVLGGRIQALSRAHQLLSEARWAGADLHRLVEEELRPYGLDDGRRIRIAGETVSLSPAQAQSLGLCLHELATNAAKHGALSRPEGRVSLDWRHEGEMLMLCWTERGGPPAAPPARKGFGATVLERSLSSPLGGQVTLDWAKSGLIAELRLPLDDARS
jgi:PAS domain S-box-containing protein